MFPKWHHEPSFYVMFLTTDCKIAANLRVTPVTNNNYMYVKASSACTSYIAATHSRPCLTRQWEFQFFICFGHVCGEWWVTEKTDKINSIYTEGTYAYSVK